MNYPDGSLIARRRVRARTQQMYSLASSVTVLNYRVRHHHCGVSFASFVNRSEEPWRAALEVPPSPFNLCLDYPDSPIYSTLPRRTVIRPPVRCQATQGGLDWRNAE